MPIHMKDLGKHKVLQNSLNDKIIIFILNFIPDLLDLHMFVAFLIWDDLWKQRSSAVCMGCGITTSLLGFTKDYNQTNCFFTSLL
jgi:hypothetical protein